MTREEYIKRRNIGKDSLEADSIREGYEFAKAKAKEAFGKACGWLSAYPWYQGVAEEFVKALED